MANTPYLGHEAQCYRWDNRCHCASSQPYQLPPAGSLSPLSPPEPPLTVRMTPGHIRSHYSSLARDAQRQAGTLYPGHEAQCYRWDNRCYCASSQTFLLPPEDSVSPLSPSEPPLTVRMTPEQIRSHYSSLARDAQRQPGRGRDQEPTVTQPSGPPQGSDLPPPYESLYPPPYTKEGQRPPEYRPRR